MVGLILAGGIAGPILMLVGLSRVSGVTGSLLLNLEGPMTTVLALALFGEHLGRREAGGAALVFLGAAVLSYGPGSIEAEPWGVAHWKTIGAGSSMCAIALATGATFPPGRVLVAALVIGAFSYGVSVLLDLHALRLLGAAREAVFFSTAPFIGALVSIHFSESASPPSMRSPRA